MDTLIGCLVSTKILHNLQAFLDSVALVCPSWFEWDGIPMLNPAEYSDYFKLTSRWILLDLLANEMLVSEGEYITRLKSHPVCGDESGGWSLPGADIFNLNARAGNFFPWSAVHSAVPQSDHPRLVQELVASVGVIPSSPSLDQQASVPASLVDTRGKSADMAAALLHQII